MRHAILALGLATVLIAQTDTSIRFDVVSLKINPSGATPRLIPRLLQFLPGGVSRRRRQSHSGSSSSSVIGPTSWSRS
jgi:hypothetical protein